MIGKTLGQYRIVAAIGRGGMGAVYRARQDSLKRDVAIKVMQPRQSLDPAQLERFKREALLVAQVVHPNIIQVLDTGEDQGLHYLVMEYVEGQTVAELLKQQGALDYLAAVGIGSQVAAGLGAAHAKGLVHRDVKPSNIIVNDQGAAKLGDFGVAALVDQPDEQRLTMTQAAVGTPYYMSPEQIRARGALTGASDVYSLGVVLYELLAGKHPFGDATPGEAMVQHVHEVLPPVRRFRSDIPDDLERVLESCLAKDRADRFPDGEALHAALEKVRVRLEAARLSAGPTAEDYRSRVTGTGFFYVDPSLGKKGGLASHAALAREMWAQTRDSHRRRRRRVMALYARAQDARQRYKAMEKNVADLRKRHTHHESKANDYKAQIEQHIAEGKADEVARLAEKEAQCRKLAVDYEHQMAELGKEVGRQRERYDRLRNEHAGEADELSLEDAETQRRGHPIPSWHVNAKLARRAQRARIALVGLVLSLGLIGLGWGLWPLGQHVTLAPLASPPVRHRATPVPTPVEIPPPAGGLFTNGLGMRFLPVPGTDVLFSVWETRVQDFQAFTDATGHEATAGMYSLHGTDWAQHGDTWRSPGYRQSPTHPVVGVSWDDAQAFCRWLTDREREAGRLGLKQRYRLPTDAEWSLAVGLAGERGITPRDRNGKIRGVYPWGTCWPPGEADGNYHGQEARGDSWPLIGGYSDGYARTAPAGSFRANTYGLHDLGGNVWEWCEDFYDGQSGARVLRGGSWDISSSSTLCSSFRLSLHEDARYDYGFRVVLAPAPGEAARHGEVPG